jgi:ribosomal protein S13
VIEGHVWGPENHWTCDVSDPTLTRWLILESDEPFMGIVPASLTRIRGIGASRGLALALAGVSTAEALAALDEDGIRRVTDALEVSRQQVIGWIEAADADAAVKEDRAAEAADTHEEEET